MIHSLNVEGGIHMAINKRVNKPNLIWPIVSFVVTFLIETPSESRYTQS